MKLGTFAPLTIVFFFLSPCESRADKFLELALWPQAQLVKQSDSIAGIRLNLYGRNQDVRGLDLGFIHEKTGDFSGVSLGSATSSSLPIQDNHYRRELELVPFGPSEPWKAGNPSIVG